MRDDPHVVALVTRASGGDQDAWYELVDRYAPLVYTICTRYRLSNHDIEDVGQNVWLLLVEQLGKLREPAALPGWLATTTARECLRVVTAARKRSNYGEASQVRNDWDDDRLLGALSLALKARQAVPSWFVETGKHAFAWHNIDAELAQLTYDSNEDRRQAAVMRSETASIRALTFTSAHLSLE